MSKNMARRTRSAEQLAQINIDFLCTIVDSFNEECSKRKIEPNAYNFAVYIIDRSLVASDVMLAIIISQKMYALCDDMRISNSICCDIFAKNYGLHPKYVFHLRKKGMKVHKRKNHKFAKSNLFL